MTNTTFVKVLNAADELPVKLGSLGLIETGVSDDEIEQLAPIGMFHDHEEFFLSLDDLIYNSELQTNFINVRKVKIRLEKQQVWLHYLVAYLIELDDVGMAHFLEDLDLARDPLDVLLVIDPLLLQDFHSNL